jgi:hypothetical protein
LGRKSPWAAGDFDALVDENLALRQELRRRKRRVLMRRVRRGSAVALPVARAISHKRANSRANDADAQPPVPATSPGAHAGVAHAAVAALVVARIVADARSHPSAVPTSPAGVS